MLSVAYVFQDVARRKVRVVGASAACKRGLDVSVREQDDRALGRAVTLPVSAAVTAVVRMELA